jgi:hypothetical protein
MLLIFETILGTINIATMNGIFEIIDPEIITPWSSSHLDPDKVITM